jgi:hypothetical protein
VLILMVENFRRPNENGFNFSSFLLFSSVSTPVRAFRLKLPPTNKSAKLSIENDSLDAQLSSSGVFRHSRERCRFQKGRTMKKNFLLICCLSLIAAVAQSQTQSGGTSAGNTGAQQTSGAANNQQEPGQINPQPGTPGAGIGGSGAIVNQPAGANRISGVTPGGDTNRIPFGGTNQIQFGGTNTGRLINEPSGATPPGQVPFGTGQPVPFGAQNQGAINQGTVNQGTGLPTNNTPLAGSGTIQEPSGAANPNNPAGAAIPPNAANADAMFAQQLKTAISRGGATRIFFPQTRSTVTLVNQNGSILLSGTVASQQEKNEIEAKVKNASGVASVNNQLQIANQGSRPLIPGQNPATGTENQRQLLNNP